MDFQVKFFHGIPNPEKRDFDVTPYLDQIKAPTVFVASAWSSGWSRGELRLGARCGRGREDHGATAESALSGEDLGHDDA